MGPRAVVPEMLLMPEQLTKHRAMSTRTVSRARLAQDGDERCRVQVQHPPLAGTAVAVDLDRPLRKPEFPGERPALQAR